MVPPMKVRLFYCLEIVILLFAIGFVSCADDATTPRTDEPESGIIISLADLENTDPNGKAFHRRIKLKPNGDKFVSIEDIPDAVSFIIVQIHAPEGNLTLSHDRSSFQNTSSANVSGSNVGLEFRVDGNNSAQFSVSNNENATADVLVAVVAYGNGAPTPGGCDLEFGVEVSPFQKLILNDETITIVGQPASAPTINGTSSQCEKNRVLIETYRMYLPAHEFDVPTYFDGIIKMMTVENIMKNGQKIQPASDASPLHRVYSLYRGTGSVYAMIATYGNYSAAYVPIATYGCSPHSAPSTCEDLNGGMARFVCALVLIIGVVIGFGGYKCLGCELFLIGAITGGLISYAIFTALGHNEAPTILVKVFGLSFLTGLVWILMPCCIGMPCTVKVLASMTLGLFVSSTLYYVTAADYSWLTEDSNFWFAYGGIVILTVIVVAILPCSSRAVCCGLIGAYSIILSLDYYTGSNLKYIIINTIRRFAVDGFNHAVVQPPFQNTDKWLVALFVVFALLGIYVQAGQLCCCDNNNRTTVFWQNFEPILSATRRGRRTLILRDDDFHVESQYYF